MLEGIARVLLALVGSIGVFLFWIIVFPTATMLAVLYVCRFIPLTGHWRKRSRK
jgi:hypothetical protein